MLGTMTFALPRFNLRWLSIGAVSLGVLLSSSLLSLPTFALRLSNGQTVFDRSPRLIRTATSYNGPIAPATYHFTLSVPEDAGKPLEAVKIQQRENIDTLVFDQQRQRAFLGDSFAGGAPVSLASIGGEQPSNPGEATVVFDPPVSPGSTVTVALRSKRNPRHGGVYLFGVTAYPAGENGIGQFLGYGRVNLYDR